MNGGSGRRWVYESIVGAAPGITVPPAAAVVLQFALFEGAVLAVAALYGQWGAVPAGTAAVTVASVGSAFMLDIGRRARAAVPDAHGRLLFDSSAEVVLGVFAYVGLLTYLFVYDPRSGAESLVASLLGPEPPLPAAYLLLLVLWDVCYRIGTAWWTAVVGLWWARRHPVDARAARALRAVDRRTAGFGLLQLVLVPFVAAHPPLVAGLVGHVVAVLTVVGVSAACRN